MVYLKGKYHHTEETKARMSLAHKGKKFTEEHKAKIAASEKGRVFSAETREKIRLASLKPGKIAVSIANLPRSQKGESAPFFGKHLSEKSKQLLSEAQRRHWKNPEYIGKQMRARNVKPNKAEIALANILNEYFPNEWKYVGDGKVIMDGICPDFININGKKQIIEFFGEHWHSPSDVLERTSRFEKFGFTTLIIWGQALKAKAKLVRKIDEFTRSNKGDSFGLNFTRESLEVVWLTCPICGKEFKSARWQHRKYCSVECTAKALGWGKRVILNCAYCGRVFERKPYRVHSINFCSRSCRNSAMRSHPLALDRWRGLGAREH